MEINNVSQPVDAPKDRRILIVIGAIIIIVAGIVTGFLLSKNKSGSFATVGGQKIETVKTSDEEGVSNTSLFPDEAVGTIKVNDKKITDEGSHILVRDGIGQNAYLTSSVVDLDKYVGKKVQVWGKTYSAQKAGWLMDIGRIKLVQ